MRCKCIVSDMTHNSCHDCDQEAEAYRRMEFAWQQKHNGNCFVIDLVRKGNAYALTLGYC